jgi:hypothetical protein
LYHLPRYATFVHGIAGLDATDKEAAAAGLPPLDSVDQWAYLSGASATAPRTTLPIGSTGNPHDTWASKNDVQVHGFIEATDGKLWKLLVGGITNNIWQGPEYPNATTAKQVDSNTLIHDCGFATGCLFELTVDETEHVDVAAENPAVGSDLDTRLRRQTRQYSPRSGLIRLTHAKSPFQSTTIRIKSSGGGDLLQMGYGQIQRMWRQRSRIHTRNC